jgi:hypothetical protein
MDSRVWRANDVVRAGSRTSVGTHRRRRAQGGHMPEDTQTPTATRRWKLGLAAALLAVGLVCLALYLRPAPRAPSAPQVDEPSVADVGTTTRSYPSHEASPAAAAPANVPAPADVAVAAADDAASALCGGKVCKEDQFCCGPPACGHCANKLTGPECPTKCP